MFWTILAAGMALANTTLPTVSPEDFSDGKSWTWDYFSVEDGSLYSTERYTVKAHEPNGVVLIEMTTQLAGQASFSAHHRLHVPVDQCLAAYRNPADFKPWMFRMEHLDNGQWLPVDLGGKNLAFEEKFNCNPHPYEENYAYKPYAVEYSDAFAGRLFRHLKWRKLPGSWFHLDGPNAGIAAEKDFSGRFQFRLRE